MVRGYKTLFYLFIVAIFAINIFTANRLLMANVTNPRAIIAPGTPVYDVTAATHMMELIKNSADQLKYHKQMIESIGKGEFTPSSLNYLGNLYTNCVGKRFILPEFLPKFNINVCSSGSEEQIGYHIDKILPNKYDNEKTRQLKYDQLITKRQQLRKKLLTTSTLQLLYHSEKDPEIITNFYKDLKVSNTQIAVTKVQAQIQLKILEELQDMKANQALIMQSMGLTN